MDLSELYAVENKIVHAVDQSGLGFVRVKAGNVYVTEDSYLAPDTAASIGRAVAVAGDGDTVNVDGGDYVETVQVVVNKDLTIVGTDGKTATTDSIGFDTTNSGDGKGWYLVTDGVTFNLSGLTLDGSGHKVFQAIRDYGSGMIDQVAFENIQYNASGGDYAGTAIVVFGANSDVDVTGSTFSGIGRVGVLYFGDTATGTFSGNTYTGKGVGDWLDYAVEVGARRPCHDRRQHHHRQHGRGERRRLDLGRHPGDNLLRRWHCGDDHRQPHLWQRYGRGGGIR